MNAPVKVADAIDCDLHPAIPSTAALLPFLDENWRELVSLRQLENLELASYPLNTPLAARPDWRPERGKPGSDLALLRAQALDAFGIRAAICNPLYGACAIYNSDLAAALCGGINGWLASEWLDKEPRLRASIVVPLEQPALAVAEIERRASDPRFVQVLLLAQGETLLGNRIYWPIYEAAERHGLVIGIHSGSTCRHAPTATGWPSYYLEDYIGHAQAHAAQVLSLICEGVFTQFPKLRVALLESGVTWVPSFLWRFDKTWRALRLEVPWLREHPTEIFRRHIRLSTQPFDGPDDPARLNRVIDQIGCDDVFVFATDYPHYQFDGLDVLPSGLSASLIQKIRIDNPLETYPRLKDTLS
jgi:predicted TIM-barrel fold metal-dependent hydrolase